MRRDWLLTRRATKFVGFGLVAVCVAVPVIIIEDVWFLSTGVWPKLWPGDEVLFHLLAAVAAAFCAANFFIFRPGLARFVAVVLAISFASYVIQPFAPIHGHEQLTALSVGRIVGFCTLLLLVRTYVLDLKAGKVAQ